MKISILLLCWNHANYLEQCLRSIAAQTDDQFEVQFLDNHSTDGSLDLARRIAKDMPFPIAFLENDRPEGICHNLNRLLAHSSQGLVAPLSTDDWYEPDYVRTMRQAAQESPDSDWFYPSAWMFDQKTGERTAIADDKFRSGDVAEETRTLDWPFGFIGLCYRRDALIRAGGWDMQMSAEDNDLLFRLSQQGECNYVGKRLVTYRRIDGSASTNLKYLSKCWDEFFGKHASYFPDRDKRMFNYNRVYAAMALDRGNMDEAKFFLRKALRFGLPDGQYLKTLLYYLRRRAAGLLGRR